MSGNNKEISDLNLSIFDSIESQTSEDDRKVLLALQQCVQESGKYHYLEIGSHLGGSIQPFWIDPLCTKIYSIDKRPPTQPDERGRDYVYHDNSSERMLQNLKNAFPSTKKEIDIFNCDATDINTTEINTGPQLCFIDGEHTNAAVFSDFLFCLKVVNPNGIIAFHDAQIVFKGIKRIKKYLKQNSIQFQGIMLKGCIYAILLNKSVDDYYQMLIPFSQNESKFFYRARRNLFKQRLNHKYPNFYSFILFLNNKFNS